MSERRVTEYDTCAMCSKTVALKQDGTFRRHRRPGERLAGVACAGTALKPRTVTVRRLDYLHIEFVGWCMGCGAVGEVDDVAAFFAEHDPHIRTGETND